MPGILRNLPLILSTLFLLAGCSGPFVKKDAVRTLNSRYNGVYIMNKDVETGNGEKLPAGMKVRLYFRSDSDSVKAYAFPASQAREEAIGKLILYKFKDDFPRKKFDSPAFEAELAQVIRPG